MSESNADLDLGEGQEGKGSGKLKSIILIAVGAIVLAGGGAWLGALLTAGDASVAEQAADVETTEMEQATEQQTFAPAIYEQLKPPFVANLPEHHLVKVSVSVMSRDQAVIDQIRHHDPAIRHEILSLLRGQSYEQLATSEGQDGMRGLIKEKVESIIGGGDPESGVEDIYLTDFIIQ